MLHGAVSDVCGLPGEVLAAADPRMLKPFRDASRATDRWVYVDAPVAIDDPVDFESQLTEQFTDLRRPLGKGLRTAGSKKRWDIVAVIFLEETGHRTYGQGWIFLAREILRRRHRRPERDRRAGPSSGRRAGRRSAYIVRAGVRRSAGWIATGVGAMAGAWRRAVELARKWRPVVAGALIVALVLSPLIATYMELPQAWDDLLTSPGYVTAVVVGLYVASCLAGRWLLIGAPVDERGRGRLGELRMVLAQAKVPARVETAVTGLLDRAERALAERRPFDRWVWSLGTDMAVHGMLDRAELTLARYDAKAGGGPASLERRVRLLPDGALRDRLLKQLGRGDAPDYSDPLAVVLAHEYDAGERVAIQQRKNLWLVMVGAVLIVTLAAVSGNAVLLLLGAAGAFVSRLFALLRSDALTAEFRFTWTANMLGPVYGALVAYGGILAIVTLHHFQLLGDAFRGVTWGTHPDVPVMGLAFLLGFSERLVERVVDTSAGIVPDRTPANAENGAPADLKDGGGPVPADHLPDEKRNGDASAR